MTACAMIGRFTPLLPVGIILLFLVGSRMGRQPPDLDRQTEEPQWRASLRTMNEALRQKNPRAAEMAWRDAYGAALASRDWEPMLEAGAAYLRIAEVAGTPAARYPKARTAFLAAFYRARQQDSLKGVLRAAEAFARLGDREVAAQCLTVAEGMAARGGDPQAQARVRALREGLLPRPAGGYTLPNAF
jgi:hypothetical protein